MTPSESSRSANVAPEVPQSEESSSALDDPRVARALDAYLTELEKGKKVNREKLLERYPEIADELARCLDALEFVSRAAPELDEQASSRGETTLAGDLHWRKPIGDFRILRELGRGGMGVVYEAEQLSLGRRVALKVLPFAAMLDQRQLQRFQNEARAAASLKHPNIVGIHSVGCERGVHYYAMEHVEGQTLAQVIGELRQRSVPAFENEKDDLDDRVAEAERSEVAGAKRSGAPESETQREPQAGILTEGSTRSREFFRSVASLGVQAAEALEHAHQMGVVHRDVKPSNLMVDDLGHLWITDFGLAQTHTDVNITMTGDVLGTLRYMSPEQATGRRRMLDHHTDVYSLGVTLYELLTLHPAFDADDRRRILRQIVDEDPRALRRLNSAVPTDMETIVLKAMAKEPEARYATAQAFADDLKRFLEHKPIRAKRPTLAQRLTKWSRRHRPIVAFAFLLMIMLLVGFAVATVLVGRQRDVAEGEHRRAEQIAQKLRQRLYAADIKFAHQAWLNADIARALVLLERCRPGRGEKDLRGFEWHYLRQLCHSERLSLRGHSGEVYFVTFSPDGRRLATAGQDGTVKVWAVAGGRPQMTLRGHTGEACGVAFSPDGRTLASAGEDRTVRLWDLATGRERNVLRGHTDVLFNAVFSPDGKLLASAGTDTVVKLWDPATGEEQATLEGHPDDVEFLAFSPDGKTLATAGGDYEGLLKLWDVAARKEKATLRGHAGALLSVAFSPDGRTLATAGEAPAVKFWDVATGREKATLRGHGNWVQSVAFSPDGELLASASRDATVRVWDVASESLRYTVRGHVGRVWCVAFSPDGRTLATAGADRTVKLWEVGQRQEFKRLLSDTRSIRDVSIAPDGEILAGRDKGRTVIIWDARTGEQIPLLKKEATAPSLAAPAFSSDARKLAVAGGRGLVEFRDLPAERCRVGSGLGPEASSIAFSPSGRLVALGTYRGQVTLWDFAAAKRLATLEGHPKGGVNAVAFSPDGGTLVTASEDASAKLWDVSTGRFKMSLLGHGGAVGGVAFSPHGASLATVSDDRTARLWDAATGGERFTLIGHRDAVTCVRFSRDGKTLFTGSADRTIKLWNAGTGQELLTLEGHTGRVSCLVPSEDGMSLISGAVGADGRAEFLRWPAERRDRASNID